MSDVMSARLLLSGVRVRAVLVDSVDRLEVEVESAREWSRCPQCGFRCQKVWDRRTKRIRDLEVSGRRTTLVWRRRRFWCGNCEERHLENHAQFQAGLTRRFARRLVRDARVMSGRASPDCASPPARLRPKSPQRDLLRPSRNRKNTPLHRPRSPPCPPRLPSRVRYRHPPGSPASPRRKHGAGSPTSWTGSPGFR